MPELTFTVNGTHRRVIAEPQETLLDVLREQLSLTGSKRGCDQASCGACTVLMDGVPVLSCITPALRCQGKEVETIEGVTQNGELHKVQKCLVESGGIQCGFCTPGVVMTLIAFLRENPNPDELQIREALSGNLCRCTGYSKIVKGALQAAAMKDGES
jgi:carbon-monoxide dehydrogenase small subunit